MSKNQTLALDFIEFNGVPLDFPVNLSSPFWVDVANPDRKKLNYHGTNIDYCFYNLSISIRDLRIYVKADMKPHRFWKISDVKTYFGINGSKETILSKLEAIHDAMSK